MQRSRGGGTPLDVGAAPLRLSRSSESGSITGKLIAAHGSGGLASIWTSHASDVYTLRRITGRTETGMGRPVSSRREWRLFAA
jgi:hypothetical protein